MAKAAAHSAAAIPLTAPIAVLHGDERFLILDLTRVLANALKAKHGEVDTRVFNGASASPAEILDECRSMGLMMQHKLIIVDEADALLKNADDDDDAPSKAPARGIGQKSARELMESYAASPENGATLVLRAGTWRKGKLDAVIERSGGVIIECESLSDADAARWAIDRAKAIHDVTLEPAAAQRLIDALGPELARLDSELAKLSLALAAGAEGKNGTSITPQLVASMVGESREEEVWGLQRSLLSGDTARALTDLQHALDISRHNPVLVGIAYLDLCRKLDGVTRGMAAKENPFALKGRLKIWNGFDELVGAAKNLRPAQTAALFQAAVSADVRMKTGQGDQVRILETLTVQIASALR